MSETVLSDLERQLEARIEALQRLNRDLMNQVSDLKRVVDRWAPKIRPARNMITYDPMPIPDSLL